jgi:hypothetical protein
VEQLFNGLQLAGFLLVSVIILAALVAVAIGIAVFLYITDREILIIKKPRRPRKTDAPVEIRS